MFRKDYEVVICGGGIAGVSAALAAARQGKKTALVEKMIWTGGLATAGQVYIYLPLCDGYGTQVTFGLTEELLLASLKYGPGEIPDWRRERNAAESKRFRVVFSPCSFILAIDELLAEAGVEIWYDTVICATQVKDGVLTGIEVENKSGRGLIEARCFVDATGDADLAHQSGLNCPEEDNYLARWVLEYKKGALFRDANGVKNAKMWEEGGWSDPTRGFTGIDGAKVSRFVTLSRERYREHLKEEYASGKYDRNSLFPLLLPVMAQFRKTRCIPGHYTLTDNQDWTSFDDSIGMAADWRKSGYVWEIPYRTLLPRGLKNLLAAGRCTAAEKDAWEITRVIPTAALTGEAAGTAAALAATAGVSPDELPVAQIQEKLRHNGNRMHFDEVGLSARN